MIFAYYTGVFNNFGYLSGVLKEDFRRSNRPTILHSFTTLHKISKTFVEVIQLLFAFLHNTV